MLTHTRSHAPLRDRSVSGFVSRLQVRKVCVFVVQCLLLLLLYCKLAVCLFNWTPKCSAHAFTHLLTAFKYNEIKLELMYTEYCDYVNVIMLIMKYCGLQSCLNPIFSCATAADDVLCSWKGLQMYITWTSLVLLMVEIMFLINRRMPADLQQISILHMTKWQIL